jgi:hypothetical protein
MIDVKIPCSAHTSVSSSDQPIWLTIQANGSITPRGSTRNGIRLSWPESSMSFAEEPATPEQWKENRSNLD